MMVALVLQSDLINDFWWIRHSTIEACIDFFDFLFSGSITVLDHILVARDILLLRMESILIAYCLCALVNLTTNLALRKPRCALSTVIINAERRCDIRLIEVVNLWMSLLIREPLMPIVIVYA